MSDRLVELFPEVALVAAGLILHPEVSRRWMDESSCADMTVGGLANHRVHADLEGLPAALAPVLDGTRTPDSVLIPWQGWSLSAEWHGQAAVVRALSRPRRWTGPVSAF